MKNALLDLTERTDRCLSWYHASIDSGIFWRNCWGVTNRRMDDGITKGKPVTGHKPVPSGYALYRSWWIEASRGGNGNAGAARYTWHNLSPDQLRACAPDQARALDNLGVLHSPTTANIKRIYHLGRQGPDTETDADSVSFWWERL
jgi:hypothetical protein